MVKIQDETTKQFLTAVLMGAGQNRYKVNGHEDKIGCLNELIMGMIRRCVESKTYVLPFVREKDVLWLVINNDFQQLVKHANEIKYFLVPALAEPFPAGLFKINKFDASKGEMSRCGVDLYPHGYFCFRSHLSLASDVLETLHIWSKLDDEHRPEISRESLAKNAYVLRSQFQQAIALQNWEEAGQALSFLIEGKYISDENCRFLKIQLLSSQGQWSEIWDDADFPVIAGLDPLPSAVRAALITSFYKSVLALSESEGDVGKTLQALKDNKSKLSTLLRYRSGLSGDLFDRVFAYQATLENNLDKLQNSKKHPANKSFLQLIDNLIKFVKVEDEPIVETLTHLELAKQCFGERLYDDAYRHLLDSPPSAEKTQILMGIATITEDEDIYLIASKNFQALDEHVQVEILADSSSKGWVKFVLRSSKSVDSGTVITNWADWFAVFLDNKDDQVAILADCLNELITETQKNNWNYRIIKQTEESLLEIVTAESISLEQKYMLQKGLPDFAGFILQDAAFPNSIVLNLYEYLILAIQNFGYKNTNNAGFLLKLSEGLMQSDITYSNKLWSDMVGWFSFQPVYKMAFYILELLELFHDYGIAPELLRNTWNNWVGSLVESFAPEKSIQIQGWFNLGKLIDADYKLLKHLEKLTEIPLEHDCLKQLDEMEITIFSCREKSAKRAAEKIIARNPKLKVRVCSDDKLTNRSKSYAKNSDIVMIVTAHISHALTYGITPYLKGTILYPPSSGETGILQELEEYSASVEGMK